MPADNNKRNGGANWRQALTTVGLALSIPWMIAAPALVGWYIDTRYSDTYPLLFIIGLIVGLIATALNIYKIMKKLGQFK
jgi:F0F1-type ATP synthase assembly protein I